MNIHISADFKKMASKAILAIALFIVTYLVLIILAVALTIGFGYAGLMLIVFKPMVLTLMLGIGMMSVGVFILLFLFKFITKKHTVDRSHLREITSKDEPVLFELIHQVVTEVDTEFPKKVYLSSEVNAAVFYNSSFWSMIFPVRKNLQIGVGLINSVTASELKAILAHEFGHFSQRSMKVGSYVYNVNQVIYNLLYENESYGEILGSWANASKYFKMFAQLAVKIIQGIQWILRKVYVVVNLKYMALSREMEFHADEVAANVTGPTPMISALLRLGLADQSYTWVLDYYSRQVDRSVKTNNVYEQQGWLMNFIAAENNMALESGLPHVSKEDMSRFNNSKLVIKDQWASHPSTEERVEHLKNLKIPEKEVNNALASSLFSDKNAVQEAFTEKFFKPIKYETTPSIETTERFIDDYKRTFNEGNFSKVYNGYYDIKDIAPDVPNAAADETISGPIHELFSDAIVDLINTANSLESDIASLKQIAEGETGIKTFDYDGQRYTVNDAGDLVVRLVEELKELKTRIENHDSKIHTFFRYLARQQGNEQEFIAKYAIYNKEKEDFDRRLVLYNKMIDETQFLQHTTSYDTIEQNFEKLLPMEKELKMEIGSILVNEKHQRNLTDEIKAIFENYLDNERSYFSRPEYNQQAIDRLYAGITNFYTVISNTLFDTKKSLLEYQSSLLPVVREAELV
ncbi:MAG: M48 family metallopeptidase [Chitinophagaceae bacterium]